MMRMSETRHSRRVDSKAQRCKGSRSSSRTLPPTCQQNKPKRSESRLSPYHSTITQTCSPSVLRCHTPAAITIGIRTWSLGLLHQTSQAQHRQTHHIHRPWALTSSHVREMADMAIVMRVGTALRASQQPIWALAPDRSEKCPIFSTLVALGDSAAASAATTEEKILIDLVVVGSEEGMCERRLFAIVDKEIMEGYPRHVSELCLWYALHCIGMAQSHIRFAFSDGFEGLLFFFPKDMERLSIITVYPYVYKQEYFSTALSASHSVYHLLAISKPHPNMPECSRLFDLVHLHLPPTGPASSLCRCPTRRPS